MNVAAMDEARESDGEIIPSASALGLVRLIHEREVTSTMDVAHALAADGAPAGCLVMADRQHHGRGRGGHHWQSRDDAGLWITLVERPDDRQAIGVLSLRLGLAIAEGLDLFVPQPVRLKWPNDVMIGTGKVAGILVEARWRDASVDWVAIGIGINRRVPPHVPSAAAVGEGVSRASLLQAIVPRIRAACTRRGHLSDEERAAWHTRDFARGRRIRAPREGMVVGISADGALLVSDTISATTESVRAGSLVFDERT